MKIIDSISIQRLDTKLNAKMIGSTEKNAKINLFWATAKNKEIYIQQFNFKQLNSETKSFKLELDDQKILQNFSQNGKFYILTYLKKSDNLKLYIIDLDGKLE